MEENVQIKKAQMPMLFPFEPDEFWRQIRLIVREEVASINRVTLPSSLYETPGLKYKPLYKMNEVCELFQVTKPTIYDWIRHGKLKPYKVRSRVFFLRNDIQQLLGLNSD
ncbi:helix-turn-helix domain-containing protein [Chitinophaga arvensicola]|uniref:DNA binding domain-containing protein, excisionase family n=1 Tax=Chitinophaga arvensicola TaxID=29529 RepID=A0A1I0SDY4_9BACT|nr:helix-turn-helix domain-containing protein [Chitinophaga arvensicola]SEW56464.1 DNA binding domain-containing protein, excisionase family [Chitinophaga arvensicola]